MCIDEIKSKIYMANNKKQLLLLDSGILSEKNEVKCPKMHKMFCQRGKSKMIEKRDKIKCMRCRWDFLENHEIFYTCNTCKYYDMCR